MLANILHLQTMETAVPHAAAQGAMPLQRPPTERWTLDFACCICDRPILAPDLCLAPGAAPPDSVFLCLGCQRRRGGKTC